MKTYEQKYKELRKDVEAFIEATDKAAVVNMQISELDESVDPDALLKQLDLHMDESREAQERMRTLLDLHGDG